MNRSNVWGSLAPYGDVSSRVQKEYLQNKEHFPFKTVIIEDSLQIALREKKKMPSLIWNLFDFITYLYSYYSELHEASNFSYKYST